MKPSGKIQVILFYPFACVFSEHNLHCRPGRDENRRQGLPGRCLWSSAEGTGPVLHSRQGKMFFSHSFISTKQHDAELYETFFCHVVTWLQVNFQYFVNGLKSVTTRSLLLEVSEAVQGSKAGNDSKWQTVQAAVGRYKNAPVGPRAVRMRERAKQAGRELFEMASFVLINPDQICVKKNLLTLIFM